MKKVKVMLSAILVMAIVAGALAFKAKKFSDFCVYQTTITTTPNGNEVLTCKTLGEFDLIDDPGVPSISSIYTTEGDCPTATAEVFTPPANCNLSLKVEIE